MAFWENAVETVTESGLGTGLLVVGGIALAWPLIRPVLRETTKLAIRGGMAAYQAGATMVAEAGEGLSDIATEARHEAASGQSGGGFKSREKLRPATESTPPSPSVSPG
ncbi:MAG: hypothetical protein JOY71_16225 [Acetobacteraceae bacterium]|nr:hypothetical protein [Acetobacteraceae bacterium]MBV8523643.1 hypothetical protein [Acetobacteraceae bacterium]